MRTVLYIRVSTNKQDASNQALQLRDYCQKMGYEVLHEYVDIISGKEEKRPAYDQMFSDARKRLFDALVFWDLSRFSRAGTLHTLQRLKELDNLGILWHSYQDAYLSSVGSFKDVVISIMATLAKVEREKISERTKAGLARAKAEGRVGGRKKGQKDVKPRRKKGYYDNDNRTKIRGGLSFINKSVEEEEQINARFLETQKPLPEVTKPKELRRWFCSSATCGKSWFSASDICPICRRKGRKTEIKRTED